MEFKEKEINHHNLESYLPPKEIHLPQIKILYFPKEILYP